MASKGSLKFSTRTNLSKSFSKFENRFGAHAKNTKAASQSAARINISAGGSAMSKRKDNNDKVKIYKPKGNVTPMWETNVITDNYTDSQYSIRR